MQYLSDRADGSQSPMRTAGLDRGVEGFVGWGGSVWVSGCALGWGDGSGIIADCDVFIKMSVHRPAGKRQL